MRHIRPAFAADSRYLHHRIVVSVNAGTPAARNVASTSASTCGPAAAGAYAAPAPHPVVALNDLFKRRQIIEISRNER